MKRKLLLCFLCVAWMGLSATTLRVEQLNETDFGIAVQTIGKIVINGTTLEFYDRQGAILYSSSMEEVSAITFTDVSTDLAQSIHDANQTQYSVYPNPAHALLTVDGLKEPTTLRLYSLEGQVVKVETGTQMHVESVPNGQYFLQFNNQIVKIIKQ